VGGLFTAISGQARNRIAEISLATGAATAWNPNANHQVLSLVLSGSTLYAGGQFGVIGGQTRVGIAALDVSTGLASPWNPNANNIVYALQLSGSTMYAAGVFTNIGGQPRNRIAAIDTGTGAATAWDPNANAAIYTLALHGNQVYAGGDFTFIGGQTRNRLASIEPNGTATFTWDPNANGSVYALGVNASTLRAGGAFNTIDALWVQGFAALQVSTAVDAPLVYGAVSDLHLGVAPNPVRAQTAVRFALPTSGPVTLALFDAAGRRVSTLLDAKLMEAGPHEVTLGAQTLSTGVYFARLEFGAKAESQKLLVIR
jgi:hypothetical protein